MFKYDTPNVKTNYDINQELTLNIYYPKENPDKDSAEGKSRLSIQINTKDGFKTATYIDIDLIDYINNKGVDLDMEFAKKTLNFASVKFRLKNVKSYKVKPSESQAKRDKEKSEKELNTINNDDVEHKINTPNSGIGAIKTLNNTNLTNSQNTNVSGKTIPNLNPNTNQQSNSHTPDGKNTTNSVTPITNQNQTNSQITDLTHKLEQSNNSIINLEQKIQQSQTNITNLEKTNNMLNTQINDYKNSITTIQNKMNEMEKQNVSTSS